MPKYDGSFKNIFIHCGNTSRLNNNGNRKSVSETGHKPHACFGRNNYTPERTGSKQRICFTRAYFRTMPGIVVFAEKWYYYNGKAVLCGKRAYINGFLGNNRYFG